MGPATASPRIVTRARPRSRQDPHFLAAAAARLGSVPPQAPWETMLAWLATALTPGNMERWFARTFLVEAEASLVIAVADGTQRDWLSQRLSARVHEVLRERGEDRPARFVLVEEWLPARAG